MPFPDSAPVTGAFWWGGRYHLALTQTTAWREATVTVGQIIQDLNGRLRPGRGWRMEVTDEFANRLYVIHLHAEKPK